MTGRSRSKFFIPPEEKTHVMPDDLGRSEAHTVLLLEDDPVSANLLKSFLEERNFRVTHVTGGAEGVQKVMALDFDVILCDMVMPAFPGDMFYRAVERVKRELCKRFIFMSGHRADPKWDGFVRQIGGLILWKPFQMHELVSSLQKELGTPL